MRVKTIELIVERHPGHPGAPVADSDLVPVRIGYADSASREKAKAAKGRWDPERNYGSFDMER